MGTQFKITDSRDLKNLEKFFKNAPKKLPSVFQQTVNAQAFTHRRNILKVLDQTMEIRAEKFVRGSVRVNLAKGGKNFSEAGSIERPRFSGWEEQQTGKPSESHRTPTLAARVGNWSKKMTGKSRLKKTNNPLTINNIKTGGTRKQKTMSLLRRAKKTRRSILVRRNDVGRVRVNKKWDAGLYQFRGKKLLKMQKFGEPQKPKKTSWNDKAFKLTEKSSDFRKEFAEGFLKMAKKQNIKIKITA